jgi:hypothetical protein
MVDLSKRMGIISSIVKLRPGLGKTAMMKYIFLLQKVYKVPLGYDFEIYTYGPYASEVMVDIDYANHQDIISIERIIYPTGHSGYHLSPSSNIEMTVDKEKEFVSKYEESVQEVITLFGDKTAKALELATTIIYLYGTYTANHWSCTLETISINLCEIKPHFDIETIRNEYQHLDGLGLLERAV